MLATVDATPHANPLPVVLRERTDRPGTFIGALPLSDVAGAVGALVVRGADRIEATVAASDGTRLATANDPRVATAPLIAVRVGSLDAVPLDPATAVTSLRAGDLVWLVVRDDDRNVTRAADAISVRVKTVGGADDDAITLTETGPETGVFAARVSTRFGRGTQKRRRHLGPRRRAERRRRRDRGHLRRPVAAAGGRGSRVHGARSTSRSGWTRRSRHPRSSGRAPRCA